MTEHEEILAVFRKTAGDMQARFPRPKAPRTRSWRRERPEYVSPFEAARAADRERQIALLRGPEGSSSRSAG